MRQGQTTERQWLVWCALVSVLCLLVLSGGEALADGKMFSRGLAPPTMPDQQAILSWHDGVEKLAIHTSFVGEGTDFAWVVPLPSRPEISSTTPGAFATLQLSTAPRFTETAGGWCVTAFLLLTIWWCYLGRNSKPRMFLVFFAFCVLAVHLLILMPTLGSARLGIDTSSGIRVLDRQHVAGQAVTVLAAERGEELSAWLASNGFELPDDSQPIIADYVARGWVFVTVSLQRDAAGTEPSAPAPLLFTFLTDTPVYPMRLTGVTDHPLELDLFVFGPSRAAAEPMRVVHCDQVEKEPALRQDGSPFRMYRLRHERPGVVGHPQVTPLIENAPILTKLSATLSPRQMQRDIEILWEPFEPLETTVRTTTNQRLFAADVAAIVGLCVVVLLTLRPQSKNILLAKVIKAHLWALVIAVVAASVVLIVNPGVSVPQDGPRVIYDRAFLQAIEFTLSRFAMTTGVTDAGAVDVATVRREIETAGFLDDIGPNQYFNRPIRESDSPGDYLVRDGEAGVEVVTYNRAGGENIIRIADVLAKQAADAAAATQPSR